MCEKSVMHVQNCCFAYQTYCSFFDVAVVGSQGPSGDECSVLFR